MTADKLAQEQAAPASPILDREHPTETIDIMVGLLTLNNAGTIESLVNHFSKDCEQSFPNISASLVNCDAGSQDGTPGIIDRIAAGMVPVRTDSQRRKHLCQSDERIRFSRARRKYPESSASPLSSFNRKCASSLKDSFVRSAPPGSINWPDRYTKPAKILWSPLPPPPL